MKEIFKDVVGFEGYYQVSNWGNVISMDRIINHQRHGRQIVKGRLMKPSIRKKNGYPSVQLTNSNNAKHFSIHRLVANAFIPNPHNLPQINHKDGDHKNNNIDNLEWCTNEQNNLHASLTGLRPKGESHGMHILKVDQVREIRQLLERGYKSPEISRQYGVTIQAIHLIKKKRNWAWVD